MPVIFPKLYIRTDLDAEVIVLTDVRAWKRGVRVVRKGTYRDTGWGPGKLVSWPVNSFNNVPGLQAPIASEVPVLGRTDQVPRHNSFAALKHANPDEVEHIPPRFYLSRESGYLFALTSDTIPEQPQPAGLALTFTVNATTDLCTATGHGFLTGDKIAVSSTTTRPAPLTAAGVYTVVKVSANTFLLRTADGSVVDFTTVGTGTHTAILIEPADQLPANEDGVIFIPDAWNPRISTEDPRL